MLFYISMYMVVHVMYKVQSPAVFVGNDQLTNEIKKGCTNVMLVQPLKYDGVNVRVFVFRGRNFDPGKPELVPCRM